ncbi:MAG: phenylalanine--tRNA ligase subunit beta, partial [Angelakisella sp.]
YAITDGIFILGEDTNRTLGMPICEAIGLNDLKVEFEITSNRPDCLSVRGLAREAAATFNKPLSLPEPKVHGCGGSIADYLSVDVQNTTLCQRYMAAVVKNVKIAPSPLWM